MYKVQFLNNKIYSKVYGFFSHLQNTYHCCSFVLAYIDVVSVKLAVALNILGVFVLSTVPTDRVPYLLAGGWLYRVAG